MIRGVLDWDLKLFAWERRLFEIPDIPERIFEMISITPSQFHLDSFGMVHIKGVMYVEFISER